MNISEEKWEEALQHLKQMREMALGLGWTGTFYVMGCNELERRYKEGERTKKLYNEIIELH